MAHALVVGAGLAGARTCERLRAAGFAGRITLVGAEPVPPYDRPPLTKDPAADVDLRVAMGLDVWAAADEVRLGVPATGLRRDDRDLRVDLLGEPVRADAVVVATGAGPVLPEGWAGPGVHVLHTRADADRFWAAATPGTDLVVLGGGWVGCEASTVAAARGPRVTLVEAAPRLLAGRVPPEVADRVAGWLAGVGVRVHLDAPVRSLVREGAGVQVDAGGRVLRGRLALVGMGVRPATDWLAGTGVERHEDGSVLVDPWGRSGVPGLFVVGDAAARWSARAAAHLPGGHWTEALNAPEQVAAGVVAWLAGTDREWRADPPGTVAPDPVPYTFSEIAGRTLQVLGDAGAPGDVLWQESGDGWSAYLVDAGGALRAVCSVGRPRDVARARRAMLAQPVGWPPARAVVGG